MSDERLPSGPDPEAITRTILETWPETDLVTIPGAWFFSLDPEQHWPNFATIVTTDEHDMGTPSNLVRPGVFRLNIGVGRATFQRLVGSVAAPDYAAFDRVLPHPVYAKQLWISILNPTDATFRDVVRPLLTEAHDWLAAQRAAPHRRPMSSRPSAGHTSSAPDRCRREGPEMGSSVVRYKVQPHRADENEALVKAVYEQLNRERPEGLHYATFRLPDGVSFMHVVFETDQPGRILGQVAAFKAFSTDIEARCDEPPVVTEVTLVGSYGFGS